MRPPSADVLITAGVVVVAAIGVALFGGSGLDLRRAIPGAIAGVTMVAIGALIWYAIDPIDRDD